VAAAARTRCIARRSRRTRAELFSVASTHRRQLHELGQYRRFVSLRRSTILISARRKRVNPLKSWARQPTRDALPRSVPSSLARLAFSLCFGSVSSGNDTCCHLLSVRRSYSARLASCRVVSCRCSPLHRPLLWHRCSTHRMNERTEQKTRTIDAEPAVTRLSSLQSLLDRIDRPVPIASCSTRGNSDICDIVCPIERHTNFK
jgi:hypothetical protein